MGKTISYSVLIPIIVVLLIVEKPTICCLENKNNVTFDCFPRERKALMRFRASFSDNPSNNMLSSWNTNSDCCAWPGVECDNASKIGHVVGLHLRYSKYLSYSSPYSMLRSEAVDPSLLELKYLSYLDLSGNDFRSSPIPSFLGSMKQLKYLNLSNAGFAGTVSHRLGNLSSLRSLDLSGNNLSGPIPPSLGNLRALRVLDLSDNNFSGLIPSTLGNLKALRYLDLSNNSLYGIIPSTFENIKALRVLDLSWNQLSGEIPIFVGQLSNLESIDISVNAFKGTLSEAHFANLSRLQEIDVGSNYELKLRVGYDWVPPFHKLKYLYMRSVEMGGHFPQWLQTQKSLIGLSLYNCSITGTLPKWIISFTNLTELYLSNNHMFSNHNHIEGPIPELPSGLEALDLDSVEIGGEFPQWLQTHKSLNDLRLSNCSITGTLPEWLISFVNLTRLYLSNNHIEGPIPELPSGLTHLDLSRNFINGSIPDSLCQMNAFYTLDLSNNHLSGNLPHCLGNLNSLSFVILSSNQISGPIPSSIGRAYHLEWLQLDNNSFTGEIPSSIKNCTSLAVLDIGDNKLTGKLPDWIGNQLPGLQALRLRNNTFYGDIPYAYCRLSQLRIMDVAHNQLTRNIPNCFGNLSAMAKGGIDADAELFGVSLIEMMKGLMMEYTGRTPLYLVNLDLSSNRLFGEIPSELTNLTGLNGLNLSHNHLRGTIPGNIGDMGSLESLDLSCNNLQGTIPKSLSNLTFLSVLNLSNNDLSGQIPIGTQLQTFNNPSSYEGNPELCGDPLTKKCHITNNELFESRKVENDYTDKIYLYASIIAGVATGFWGYFGVLIFKRSWRLALFRHMDTLISKMLGRY